MNVFKKKKWEDDYHSQRCTKCTSIFSAKSLIHNRKYLNHWPKFITEFLIIGLYIGFFFFPNHGFQLYYIESFFVLEI